MSRRNQFFLQFWTKMLTTNQIRLQYSLIINYLWKESSDILDFLDGDNHKRKVELETTTFWLGANQIAGFFDHQCLWKEL